MYTLSKMISLGVLTGSNNLNMWLWLPLGTVMHLLAFFLVTFHCLRHRREATSAVLWIFVAWSLPLLGPLIFLFFGVNRVSVRGWHKHRSDEKFLSERKEREETLPLAYWKAVHKAVVTKPESPFPKAINEAMNTILSEHPLLGGNSIEPLVTGDKAFPEMLRAIDNAKHHIHLQTFIINNDSVGCEFLERLRKKAESGVKVRLLYDRFGSTYAWISGLVRKYKYVPNMRLVGWTQVNPMKRQFRFNLRNHRKLLIVDGKEAFTGGMNLDKENKKSATREAVRDYNFSIRGPIVQELQYSFLRDWFFMTDENPEILLSEEHFPNIDPQGEALIRLINGGPTAEIETITDVFFASIVSARKQILAVTPYMVPTQDILRALRSAALRGVDVSVIVPAKSNHVYAGLAGKALYDDLLSAGVKIFERREPFIHAKALIIDSELAIIGTANLDVRSLRLNYETNLAVYNEHFLDEIKRIVLEDIAMSDELQLSEWRKRSKTQCMLENFCNLLTPIL